MPLFKPSPGDTMLSAHAREHAIYSESNHVRVGPGLTCRRTPAGTSIALSGALLATQGGSGGDSESPGSYWALDGAYTACYGDSIGTYVSELLGVVKRIDLAESNLAEAWSIGDADDEDGALTINGDAACTDVALDVTGRIHATDNNATISINPKAINTDDKTMMPRLMTVYIPTEDGNLQARKVWVLATEGEDVGDPVEVPSPSYVDGEKRYARIAWDDSGNYLNQFREVYSAATKTWTEEATPTVSIPTESHSSQHA